MTSFDAVAAVRGALHTKKVGHAGTLDPMATGMLVIGFGRATRLLQYIVEHDKTYEATIRLGMRTTTDDAEGETIIDPEASAQWAALSERVAGPETETDETGDSGDSAQAAVFPTARAWRGLIERTIAERFLGDIEQVPNTFSAIKINGKRAYDLAREGRDVELRSRPVHIAEFSVLDVRIGRTSSVLAGAPLVAVDEADATIPVIDVDVRVSCSSGTYIRALARDLGETLGVGGHLTRLRRTRVGRFCLPDDRSGLGTTVQAITAHAEQRTFTNREGETITRARCVLDAPEELSGEERADWLLARAVPMGDAARGAMPVIEIDDAEARELRFGRRLERRLAKDVMQAAAIVPATAGTSDQQSETLPGSQAQDDVVAIVERANAHQIKPSVVFPTE
ncbi:tRNA pseudouridine(55) synthase TruB [Bifidobacterium callitrichos]|uniref:tRNA pseudouridine synthase B n=1 Tax=Bifidobacterium callitrichos TaxID=762209 RepID=A0A5M9ZCZ5_9BIFI|nr:tRNA pseudouridine(55) synthase TruB [Bifidobacterium callitrichos]